ncbi:MAG: NMD3-related protein [archaeon]
MKVVYDSGNNYWEAVIQLRPFDDEVFRFIQNQVKKRKSVFISRIFEVKGGVDIYLSSQRYARSIAAKLKKFKGEVKVTHTLHTRDNMKSKDLYRATVLFRKHVDEESNE